MNEKNVIGSLPSRPGEGSDDVGHYSRGRSRSTDYYSREEDRHRDRSHGSRRPGRSGSYYRNEDDRRSRIDYERESSYGPASERDYERDHRGEFRRDRSGEGDHREDFRRDRSGDGDHRGDFRRDRSGEGEQRGDFRRHRSGEGDQRGDFRRDRSEPPSKRGRRSGSPPRDHDSHGHRSRSFPVVATREWPPCFDDEGSAFVFHPATGMFYEETSDFFFDPKAKLYYGNKKKAYFRYDDSCDPPFVETQGADPSHGTPMEPVAPSLLLPPTTLGSTTDKPKIVINLKTKKMKTSEATTAGSSPIALTKVQKSQVANIEKWQVKQTELKTGSNVPLVPALASSVEIQRTTKGEPICVVCQRKFPSIEKLRLHEAKSELHKTNLEKQQAQLQQGTQEGMGANGELQQTTSTTETYNDRAEKRRNLHGSYVEAAKMEVLPLAEDIVDTLKLDNLGETNVGNKLLQKMGWQTGDALGGRTNNDDQNSKSANDLRKDWDRIEAIAAKKHS